LAPAAVALAVALLARLPGLPAAAFARPAELALLLALAALLPAAVERLKLADRRVHRLDVGAVGALGARLLRGFLLGAQQLLQPRHGVVARGFEAGFALDFLAVHLDGRDEVGDLVGGVLGVHIRDPLSIADARMADLPAGGILPYNPRLFARTR